MHFIVYKIDPNYLAGQISLQKFSHLLFDQFIFFVLILHLLFELIHLNNINIMENQDQKSNPFSSFLQILLKLGPVRSLIYKYILFRPPKQSSKTLDYKFN